MARSQALAVLVILSAATWASADENLANLLELDAARIERTAPASLDAHKLRSLTDGDVATSLSTPGTPGVPLEIVYGFSGKTVAPEKLTVECSSRSGSDDWVGRVEVLVSMLSPHVGFQSLRTDRFKAKAGPWEFPFPVTAARWIMIRVTSVERDKPAVISEIAVLGREGPPATRYAFKESPATALEVLAGLKESVDVSVTEDEAALFADAEDGRLDRFSFAEAALLASGITDRVKRRAYLQQINALHSRAAEATRSAATPFEKGEKLLQWLHAEPMAKGYVARQTDLSAILDTGTFNCVSSAALYNVFGRRLGLDLRAIEVPDHAFSILYDGTRHADVETTTPQGFNPARDPEAQRQFSEKTGFRYIPERHRDERREISQTGLVALIYYNHGVRLTEEERFDEALLTYFRALSLDREFASAVKNVLAVLANWSVELADAGDFESALKVVRTGLALAPEDATLVNNRRAIWTSYAESAIEAGASDQALAILRRAEEDVPKGDFRARQAWVFLQPAEQLIEKGSWEEALAAASAGIGRVDAEAEEELRSWRGGLFLRWSGAELEQERFDAAADVLHQGLTLDPNDKRCANNLGYLAQEWSWFTYKNAGIEEARDVLRKLIQRFPGVADVPEAASHFVRRLVVDLREAGKFEEALLAAEQCAALLQKDEDLPRILRGVFDAWAQSFRDEGDWEKALDVYEQALNRHPDDKHLAHNAVATWDAWVNSYADAQRWADAVAVCEKAAKRSSDHDHFDRNLGYLAQEWSSTLIENGDANQAEKVLRELVRRHPEGSRVADAAANYVARLVRGLTDDRKYDDALAAIERCAEFLADAKQDRKLAHVVYDCWASALSEEGKWESAVGVYKKGLTRYAEDGHLERNAIATWNAWANTLIDASDWPAAIEVYREALVQFPQSGVLKNNLEFCRQKMGR